MQESIPARLPRRSLSATSMKSVFIGLIAVYASCSFAVATTTMDVTNPFSAFLMTVDGQFTDGVTPPATGEWSDVTPAAFISTAGASPVSVPLGDPGANSLLYAALGNSARTGDQALFLMYDFLPRTLGAPILPGELLASITFPVTLPGQSTGEKTTISVLFNGINNPAGPEGPEGVGSSFFDVFVDLDLDGIGDAFAHDFGIIGALGFGPSTLSPFDHLLAELEVPLRIPAGFADPGGPLPGNGINPATGLYDPDPAFWGAAAQAGSIGSGPNSPALLGPDLQPASGATFTINPDGSVLVAPFIPEPSRTVLLLIAGLGVLATRRRTLASS